MISRMTIGVACVALVAVTLCFEPSAFAQSDTSNASNGSGSSASSSMHRAGEATEAAVSNAYHGTKSAV